MAAIVFNALVDEAGEPVVGAYIEIRLLATTNLNNESRSPAFYGQSEVVSRIVARSDSDGRWEFTLIANADMEPANTYYRVWERISGLPDKILTFAVPGTGGPYWVGDLLIDPPDDLPNPGGGGSGGNSYGWYDDATIGDDGQIVVEFTSLFGINEDTGLPYYNSEGATEGEEAVLLPDLTLMQPGR